MFAGLVFCTEEECRASAIDSNPWESDLRRDVRRSECAKERGYKTVLLKILHPEASTKNDMIVGAPDGKFAGGIKTLQDDFPLVVPEA
jgi:hypothetical protein